MSKRGATKTAGTRASRDAPLVLQPPEFIPMTPEQEDEVWKLIGRLLAPRLRAAARGQSAVAAVADNSPGPAEAVRQGTNPGVRPDRARAGAERKGAAFGLVLRRCRLAAGLSQEALGHSADLHPTYVSLLERGINAPTLPVIEALAEALGCQPHELVKAAADAATQGSGAASAAPTGPAPAGRRRSR